MPIPWSGRLRRPSLALSLAALAVPLAVAAHLATASRPASADDRAPRVPVLVELFTSEGCSSCPPAEDELARLERDQPVPGVRIVPVAFHVEYWNGLGWADPFSTAAWTERQKSYARARDGRVYTPQAIVQGAHDCVGSDDVALRTSTRQAALTAVARVTVEPSAEPSAAGQVRVTVRVTDLPAVAPGDEAEVRVALVERGLAVDVPRGENAGKRLLHAPLARDLRLAGPMRDGAGTFDIALAVPPGGRREALSAVAFVQERGTRHVLGVGTLAL
jgi:hypothetical protein